MAGSIIGGIFGMKGAEKQAEAAEEAARAQVEAARIGADTQREMFDTSVQLGRPWRTRGQNALGALSYELGLGPKPRFLHAPYYIGANDPKPLGRSGGGNAGGGNALSGGGGSMAGGGNALGPFNGGGGGGPGDPHMRSNWGSFTGGRGRNDPYSVPHWKRRGYHNSSVQMLPQAPAPVAANDAKPKKSLADRSFAYTGFKHTPGYKHNLDEGQKAINRSLASRGGLLSGAAVKEGMRFGQGLANQEYSNHLARLAAMSGMGGGFAMSSGENAITTGSNIANTMMSGAQGQGNALMAAGEARQSGYNALGQGLSTGLNSLFGFAGFGGGSLGGGAGGFGMGGIY